MFSRQPSGPGQLFVIGSPRSGTTWLANLLASHSAIAAVTAARHFGVHESHLFDHTRYHLWGRMTCEEFVARYSYEDYFQLTDVDAREICREHPTEGDVVDFFGVLMGVFTRKRGARLWLEKTPQHTMYLDEIARRFPHAHFVVIRRRFRDTLHSNLNMFPAEARRWLQILEKVVLYVSDERAIERLLRNLPDRVTSVRYEELAQDPQATVRTILHELRLPAEHLESPFSRNTSYGDPGSAQFVLSPAEGTLAAAARTLVRSLPFALLRAFRRRRNRGNARSFPRYPAVAASDRGSA